MLRTPAPLATSQYLSRTTGLLTCIQTTKIIWRSNQSTSALVQTGNSCHDRKGNCLDNTVAERFFLNLKMKRIWQRQYANHAEVKADITDYVLGFYNCKRINSALGNLPPSVYEQKMADVNLSLCPKLLDNRTIYVNAFKAGRISDESRK